jgi:hypothetical protein
MMEDMANPEYASDESHAEPLPAERRRFLYLMRDGADAVQDDSNEPAESWLDRLQHDVNTVPMSDEPDLHVVDGDDEPPAAGPINYAALEFEIERMRKRIAIWEILMVHMRAGAESWSDIQAALTPADCDRIIAICDGGPLGDLLYLQ